MHGVVMKIQILTFKQKKRLKLNEIVHFNSFHQVFMHYLINQLIDQSYHEPMKTYIFTSLLLSLLSHEATISLGR